MSKDVNFGTEAEWIEELESICRAAEEAEGFLSVTEISSATSKSRSWVLNMIRKLHTDGRVEVKKILKETITGDRCRTPVYRLLPEKEK